MNGTPVWISIAAVVVGVILTAVMGTVGFLVRRMFGQFDTLAAKVELKADTSELDETERRLEDLLKQSEGRFRYDLAELKRERQSRDEHLDAKLDEGFSGINRRIDDLYKIAGKVGASS